MRRRFLRGLAPWLLAGLGCLPPGALGQEMAVLPGAPAPVRHAERPQGPPAAVAILFTVVVVVLVCLPIRKGPR